MGFYVELPPNYELRLMKLRLVIQAQFKLHDSELPVATDEFFLLVNNQSEYSLYGIHMRNGSGIYQAPKFIDVEEGFQYHHLRINDRFPIATTEQQYVQYLLENPHVFVEFYKELVSEFSSKMKQGRFLVNGQILNSNFALPNVETDIQQLCFESIDDAKEDAFGNCKFMRLNFDLCAFVQKELNFEDCISLFADDLVRSLASRFRLGNETETEFPRRFYVRVGWLCMSCYLLDKERTAPEVIKETVETIRNTVTFAKGRDFSLSCNELN